MGVEMSDHHPFGPSSLERRELCPGSFRLERDLPDMDGGADAARGTHLHFLIAQMLVIGLQKIETPEDTAVVQAAVKFIDSLDAGTAKQVAIEHRVAFYDGENAPTRLLYHGTVDYALIYPDRAIIVDWKTGWGETTAAPNNLQGAAYALAIMQEFSVPTAEVHFFNPTTGAHSSHSFTNWQTIRDQIVKIIETASAPDAPVVSGLKQCKYCKAARLGTCPAMRENMEMALRESKEMVALHELEDAELVSVFERLKLVDILAKRVDDELKRRCTENGECAGYKIKETSGGYLIEDIQAAYMAVCQSGDFNLPQQKFLDCCSVSPSSIKRIYATETTSCGYHKTKKEAEKVITDRLGEILKNRPPRKTLEKNKE
jgi:hypothetical protein